LKVKEIMSSPVVTVGSEAVINEAAGIMKSSNVGMLPVIEANEIIGLITDRDIVLRIIAEKLDPEDTPVNKAMTTKIMCCFEGMDVEEAAAMMQDKKVHRLLVLGNDDTVVGILSTGDFAGKTDDEHLLHEVLGKICEPANAHL
jgi:CBS domain-containing protein